MSPYVATLPATRLYQKDLRDQAILAAKNAKSAKNFVFFALFVANARKS